MVVLNEADPPPFSVDERDESDEQIRLRYRYVDLRRPRLQRNLRLRARVNAAIRAAMDRQGFCEVETPLLWAPTPEGSREFSVPSRLHHGSFYALPQSPQLAKQLLMVGGVDRYYQIARCLRDEDLRADRQFEFSQLDMEASFATQDDIMGYVSEAVLDAAEAATGERPPPIERMTWTDALEPLRHRQARPALRDGAGRPERRVRQHRGAGLLELARQGAAGARRRHLPPFPPRRAGRAGQAGRSRRPGLVRSRREGAAGPALDSPLDRFLSEPERAALLAKTGAREGDLILAVSDTHRIACTALGHTARPRSARRRWARARTATSGWWTSPCSTGSTPRGTPSRRTTRSPCRTPRTCPAWTRCPSPCAPRPTTWSSTGGSSGRAACVSTAGTSSRGSSTPWASAPQEAESRFGFLLSAFRYGAPPHAGFAFGIDRLAAVLAGEENIREVIAYPKTQSGADLLTGAPAPLPAAALAELGIRTVARLSTRSTRPLEPLRRRRPPQPGAPGSAGRPAPAPHASTRWWARSTWSGPGLRCAPWPRADRVGSAILWGPAGTGKTTLARLLAATHGQAPGHPLGHRGRCQGRARGAVRGRAAAGRARAGHHALRRRGAPLQQVPAGRAPAGRRGRAGGAGRGHHREPLLRGQPAPVEPLLPVATAARSAPRTCAP